ncbi:protein phosphatase regulator [Diaporthe eres]|uniref:Protein phosphatase regulator n=1 Tax=Diaporthe eres TaxID=83184 RepID=A0ABR1PD77_DIAER
METFQHTPLDRSKECIRLLRFVDRPPSSEQDHFVLETYDIATAPRFVALSYTWGYHKAKYDIIVNGSLLAISENLWVALKALRSFFRNDVVIPNKSGECEDERVALPRNLLQENGYPLMWIDAICIDQSDDLEKNHQVNMMGSIFTTAGCVISWLGEEADNSRCAMRAIRATTHTRHSSDEVKQAMDAFAWRAYWRRMWIIQEFILAQNVVILCGYEGAWWKDLVHFWHDTKVVHGAEGVHVYSMGCSAGLYPRAGLDALIFAREFRGDSIFQQIEPLSLDELMTTFSYGRCRDRRDRIYALLALVEPQAGVEPLLADYTISAEKLYYRVLKYIRQLVQGENWTGFRKKLGKALGRSAWADTEAAKMHEVVSEIIEMECSHEVSIPSFPIEHVSRVAFTKGQKYLAKHLEQPVDSVLCEGDRTYHDLIRRFQAFPRGEDPDMWRRFDLLLRRWLEILPASDDLSSLNEESACSLDDLSDDELGSDILMEDPKTDLSLPWPEFLEEPAA